MSLISAGSISLDGGFKMKKNPGMNYRPLPPIPCKCGASRLLKIPVNVLFTTKSLRIFVFLVRLFTIFLFFNSSLPIDNTKSGRKLEGWPKTAARLAGWRRVNRQV
jgi:hypothetical protein